MSHDIYLTDKGGRVLNFKKPHGLIGGTYSPGDTEAYFNITYNYGIGWLLKEINGKRAADTIKLLDAEAEKLGDKTDQDYWKPEPGNIKRAILSLKHLAQLAPEGIWKHD